MADERCVFPGDGSRTPGRWLDRDAAERLLSGERLETVDADSRAEADRLAEALGVLGAMTAVTGQDGSELPGEAAALAAFRAVRTTGTRERTGSAETGTYARLNSSVAADTSLDAGLVRLGRAGTDRRAPSVWGRPVRHGLAAALAAGMIGGVAMAATAGVLAFGGDEPEPGASATVAVTPDRPLRTPSPGKSRGGADEPRPDGGAGAPSGENSVPRGEARGDTDTGTGPDAQPGSDDSGREHRPGRGWAGIASACRDHRDGKELDAGRRRALEDAAHGAGQVQKYCRGLLGNGDRPDSGRDWSDPGSGQNAPRNGNGNGGKGDSDGGQGDGGGKGDHGRNGGDDGDDRGNGNGNGGNGSGGGKDRDRARDGRGHTGTGTFRAPAVSV